LLDPSSEWSFESVVPRSRSDGVAFEAALRGKDGRPTSGGANVSAVRRLSEAEFAGIVQAGLRSLDDETEPWSETAPQGLQEGHGPFDPAPLAGIRPDILMSRKYRDRSFQRQVLAAYDYTCAISGLALRNGGGRPEVQAAHIRPVSKQGPDTVRNGLALSGTLHWMFDRGLVSVAEDHRILISHNKVPDDVARRLVVPGQRLHLPQDRRLHPHPDYLRFHREEVFGQYH
jgi:putative restriction endonuclease